MKRKRHDKQYLVEVAKAIDAKLPDNHGFIALVVTPETDGKARVNYTSNLRREDAIKVLKEWLISAGAGEDWMKHLD